MIATAETIAATTIIQYYRYGKKNIHIHTILEECIRCTTPTSSAFWS
jgi:hypothetical protein